MKSLAVRVWPYVFLTIVSYWSFKSLLTPYFFPIHDDTQVARVYVMTQALRDGQFPVRFVEHLGYGFGYPLFNFYAPLPYYIASSLTLLGFDVLLSTKIMFAIGMIFGTMTMFYLGKRFFGLWGGLLSATYFTYAPYRALDIYIRGAVGEFWAMAILPLLFLSVFELLSTSRISWKSLLIVGVSFAAIVLSHNITALITLIGLIGLFSIRFIREILVNSSIKQTFHLFLAVIFGLGLSAFFWLPALAEKDYTSVHELIERGSSYRDHYVEIDQLWDFPWGFGGSAPGRADGISFKLGKNLLLTAAVAAFWVFLKRKNANAVRVVLFSALVVTIISVFMTLSISYWIWQIFPLLEFVQFPWRFLVFTTLALSFISGSIFLVIRRFQLFVLAILVFLTIIYYHKYFAPQTWLSKTTADYISEDELQWRVSKISDEYLPKEFQKPTRRSDIRGSRLILSGDIEVLNGFIASNQYQVTLNNREPQSLVLPLTYFPGWKVQINGQNVPIQIRSGKIALEIPEGKVTISANLTNTALRGLANSISFLAIFCFGVYLWLSEKFTLISWFRFITKR